ncbi:MAG: DNA alkylation repair protein [Fimbriimonadaceae bacterium]|nr:DNA alkylation repair protein [Fimbriimonadaceae bacterium]
MARSTSGITPERRALLESGQDESRDLMEGLVIRMEPLLTAVAPAAVAHYDAQPELGFTKRLALAGSAIAATCGHDQDAVWMHHPSDTVRGMSAFVCLESTDDLATLLDLLTPLATDSHFGVREWAWLAARDRLIAEDQIALDLFVPWTKSADPNLRRFAIEATRPCGVWCANWRSLRAEPERGMPLLEPLRADESKYVQLSVANWLNDASKDHPEWVVGVTTRWLSESPCPATEAIVKRATRNLG